MSEKRGLSLVATPIGNLQDLSERMVETFKSCDLIACEDTRVTRKILTHLNIAKPLVSYREENELKQTQFLCAEIEKGKKIVLVSDAGYPGISDPDFQLSGSVAGRVILYRQSLDPMQQLPHWLLPVYPLIIFFFWFSTKGQSCVWKTFGKVATIRRFFNLLSVQIQNAFYF